MQRVKTYASPRLFYSCSHPINYSYEIRFSKHNLKEPDAFSKHANFLTSYRSPKLSSCTGLRKSGTVIKIAIQTIHKYSQSLKGKG